PDGGMRATVSPNPPALRSRRRFRRRPTGAPRRRHPYTPPVRGPGRTPVPRSPRGRARASAPGRSPPAPAGRPRRRGAAGSAEGALQLLEEPLVRAVRVHAGFALEVLQERALFLGQVARNPYVHEHAVVSPPEALEDRHAAAAQDAGLARLRARRELQVDVTFDRRHGDRRPERRRRHREVDRREDVVPLPDKAWIGPHAYLDVAVARSAAQGAGVT